MSDGIPSDVEVLARDLGITGKHLRGLYRKHGNKLLEVLQKRWVERDRPRWLHKDPMHGYTFEESMRLPGEAEAVPEEYQKKISAEARLRDLNQAA